LKNGIKFLHIIGLLQKRLSQINYGEIEDRSLLNILALHVMNSTALKDYRYFNYDNIIMAGK
jgi:hypothetical protein